MLPTEMFVCEQNHDVKQKQKDQHAFSQFGFLFLGGGGERNCCKRKTEQENIIIRQNK